jgi:hypothetical protein
MIYNSIASFQIILATDPCCLLDLKHFRFSEFLTSLKITVLYSTRSFANDGFTEAQAEYFVTFSPIYSLYIKILYT